MTSIQIDLKDGLASSVAIKGPVKAATTANITLSGAQTIDGVSIVTDDRVLVKNQSTASQNGLYVADTGNWRRSKDFKGNRDVKTGTLVLVTGGTVGAGVWQVTTTDPITIDTTSITFSQTVQPYDADLASWAAITRAAGFDAFTASPSSANLRALLTDETGSGAAVFATSPALVTPTITGLTTAANINSTAAAAISQSWAGATPKVALNYNLTAASATDQEAGAIFRMTSSTGSASGTGPLSAFKIPLGTEMTMNPGSGNGYAFNAVITAAAGVGYQQVSGIEINQNINNQDYPFTVGQPLATYLNMGGISAFPATAYAFVNDVGSTTFGAHYGLLFYGAKTVKDSTFRDDTSSTVSVDIRGTHTYGIDTLNLTGKPIRLANNTSLYWRNAANSADLDVLSVNGGNNVVLGNAASGVFSGAIFAPSTDAAFDLGVSTSRWRHVYLSTGSTLNFNNGNYIVTHSSGTLTFSGAVLSSNPTGGIGYATGAGGTVTQLTSKSTGVTLNKACGQITMNNAALAAGTIVSFAVTNSAAAATDVVVANHILGGTNGAYTINGRVGGAGSLIFDVRNNTAGSLSEAIVIQFALIKAVNA